MCTGNGGLCGNADRYYANIHWLKYQSVTGVTHGNGPTKVITQEYALQHVKHLSWVQLQRSHGEDARRCQTSRSEGCSGRGLIQQSPKGTFLFLPLCAPKRWIWTKKWFKKRKEKRKSSWACLCEAQASSLQQFNSNLFFIGTGTIGVWWDSLSLAVLHRSFRMWSLLLLPLEVTQPDFVVQKWKEKATSVSLFSWSLSCSWHTNGVLAHPWPRL